jgi:hypothetical protein
MIVYNYYLEGKKPSSALHKSFKSLIPGNFISLELLMLISYIIVVVVDVVVVVVVVVLIDIYV